MKIFTKFFNPITFEEKMGSLKHINFSLFIDDTPKKQEDLSEINIMVLAEPNEYFGLHDWTIQNKDLFSFILTWDDRVLNNCKNALFFPFGQTWFKSEQYLKKHKKKFELSHLCGELLKSYGHQMRHEILERETEFHIPTNFYKTIGDRHNEDDARIGKETVFGNSQFGVVIENFSHRGFFSEKIIDCFLMKTIPIYWGCSNIGDFFDNKGIINFSNVDDLILLTNELGTSDFLMYESSTKIIEKNYQKALKYISYEQSIINKITEIFNLNNL